MQIKARMMMGMKNERHEMMAMKRKDSMMKQRTRDSKKRMKTKRKNGERMKWNKLTKTK